MLSCLAAWLIMIFMVGCADRGKPLQVEFVQGTVSLDGEPVSEANVSFIPIDQEGQTERAGGYSDNHGRYRLTSANGNPEQGAVAGEYRIVVQKILTETIPSPDPDDGSASAVFKTTHMLPEIYRDRKKTPLAATVNKGKNTIDIELKSKP